ncbi:MAG: thioredoxin family protein [Clostridia bacterium]
MKDKKVLKILVPILIVLVIAAIGVGKNFYSTTDQDTSFEFEDENFALDAESIDLDVLLSYNLPMMLDFGSVSCIPCKMMASVLYNSNIAYQGKAIVKFVDVWEFPNGVGDFPVEIIPTQFFINADGSPYEPSFMIESELDFLYYYDDVTGELLYTAHQGAITQEQVDAIFAEMGVE